MSGCDRHFKRVNVLVEPDPKQSYESVVPIHGYTVLKPGSSQVSIGLHNYSCRRVTLTAKSIVAKITAANVVPHSLAPNVEKGNIVEQPMNDQDQEHENMKTPRKAPELTPEREKLLFDNVDLAGASCWDPQLNEEAKQLFREYAHIFALESLDMGHTSMVKHEIKLDDYTPFKERYCRSHPVCLTKLRII